MLDTVKRVHLEPINMADSDFQPFTWSEYGGQMPWILVSIIAILVLVLVIVVFLYVKRRRSSKVDRRESKCKDRIELQNVPVSKSFKEIQQEFKDNQSTFEDIHSV